MMTVWLLIQENSLPEHGSLSRHAMLAKQLATMGYLPVVMVASRTRCSDEQMIHDKRPYLVDDTHGFPFIYIRVNDFGDSMKKRLLAIIEYHFRLARHAGEFSGKYGTPKVILGSSNYPVTPTLARKLAKRLKAKSICEVRDLWPLSLEVYEIIKKGGLIARAMYVLERRNYEMADAIIFTMEGGAEYIREQKWDIAHGGKIDLSKVFHINNGVDLDEFDKNASEYALADEDLDNPKLFKVVYTGSIRKANNLNNLLDVAALLGDQRDIRFLVWGSGNDLPGLKSRCASEGIDNVAFKGSVPKKMVPGILRRSDVNIQTLNMNELGRFGMSGNKQFEYLAAGKPIVSGGPCAYSVIEKYDCGIDTDDCRPQTIADAILRLYGCGEARRAEYGSNARKAAKEYDFKNLAKRLTGILTKLQESE